MPHRFQMRAGTRSMLSQQQRLAGLSPELARQAIAIAQALELRHVDEAEHGLAAALTQAPQHPEILRLLGIVQVERRRPAEAIQTLLQAAELQPQDTFIPFALAGAFEAVNDIGRAVLAMRRACALGPELAACWFNLGRLLLVNAQSDQAVAALQRAVELAPRHAHARTLLATVLNLDGRAQDAAAQYRAVLAQDPACGQAWWGLAMLKPMPLDAADIARMQQVLDGAAPVDGNERIATWFALGHAFEHQGDYAHALAAMHQANGLARRANPWNADEFNSRVDSILEAFSAAATDGSADQGKEAIFIVSLPRSGSTLTEQILASHSQVEGTTELPDLPQLIAEESNRLRQPFAQWAATRSPQQWLALGQRYLARTARWRQQRPRSTDKMPGNWLYVGVIRAMLPQARVVIVRRDRLETCFGCYRYKFNQHGYTHDFADLATAWRGFDRVCGRWRQLYPERVHELIYEQLQLDPETQIRELLAFCDLPFEAACLNFQATQRRVATPSAGQVRQALRSDTARAQKYGMLLDPLRAVLGLPPFQAQ